MNKIIIAFLCIVLMSSCLDDNERLTACDLSFKMIMISFTDKDGKPVAIKDFSAVNQRTKDTIKSAGVETVDLAPGTHVVVDDAYRNKLSYEGDEIKVSGTSTVTNQTKSVMIKVARRTCHIEKISGVEKVKFD